MPQSSLESQTAPPRLHFRVPPEPSHLLRARERLRDYLRQYCTEHQVIDDVVLCVEEACTNAIRHGDSLEDIEIALHFTQTKLVATIKDHGRGFNVASFDPEVPPDPMLDHGRGLYIVAKLMDSLELRLDGGLEVRMARRAAPRCEPASLESGLEGPHSGGGLDSRYSRVRAMLEEIDEAFIALDWEYRYVHVNEAMLRFTQTSRDELLGRVIWDLFPALKGSPVQEHYREAMELGRPSVFEHRAVVTGDWLEIRIYPTSVGVSAYYREINQRKRAETRLRESQALLQAVLDGSPDPIFVKDRESRMLLGNAALLEVWGKPAEEVIGKNDRELYADPAIGETMMENDRAVMESGQSQVLEETVQTQDGLRTYLSTKSPYRNGEGKIVGILGIARDISERKRSETALRESEERFRSLFESTAEGIALHEVVYDEGGHAADYRIIDVNPSFESQTGLRAQDARGRLASELYGTGEAPYLAEYARVAEGGGPFCFETYFAPMERHFQITATSPSRGRFATILRTSPNASAPRRSASACSRSLSQSAQTEELQTQTEELRVRVRNSRSNEEPRSCSRSRRDSARERAARRPERHRRAAALHPRTRPGDAARLGRGHSRPGHRRRRDRVRRGRHLARALCRGSAPRGLGFAAHRRAGDRSPGSSLGRGPGVRRRRRSQDCRTFRRPPWRPLAGGRAFGRSRGDPGRTAPSRAPHCPSLRAGGRRLRSRSG